MDREKRTADSVGLDLVSAPAPGSSSGSCSTRSSWCSCSGFAFALLIGPIREQVKIDIFAKE